MEAHSHQEKKPPHKPEWLTRLLIIIGKLPKNELLLDRSLGLAIFAAKHNYCEIGYKERRGRITVIVTQHIEDDRYIRLLRLQEKTILFDSKIVKCNQGKKQ